MRLAMHNWMRSQALATTLERLRRCGYDALEISGEPEPHAPEPTARLLAAHGIRCWGARLPGPAAPGAARLVGPPT